MRTLQTVLQHVPTSLCCDLTWAFNCACFAPPKRVKKREGDDAVEILLPD